jgi:hypothetical protein
MPVCRRCDRVQPTAEVRRTPLGFVCKDKPACARRVSLTGQALIELNKSTSIERSAAA